MKKILRHLSLLAILVVALVCGRQLWSAQQSRKSETKWEYKTVSIGNNFQNEADAAEQWAAFRGRESEDGWEIVSVSLTKKNGKQHEATAVLKRLKE